MTASSSAMMAARSVKRVLKAPRPHWVGDGFHVFPVFGDLAFTKELSPLLMFDYAAPKEFPPRPGKAPLGVGQHPHRGFETVTVAFEGEVEHKDSTGKSGVIQSGDVQWMTAGRGIIHQEFHSNDFTEKGGQFSMAQLWVNLPKKHKMTKPRYQPILNSKIPEVPIDTDQPSLGSVRVIAGEYKDTKGAAKTFSPVQLWDVSLPNKSTTSESITLPYPAHHNCIVFCRRGSVELLGEEEEEEEETTVVALKPQDVAILEHNGESVKIRVTRPDTSLLIMGGEPIDEPIAAHGPFVMNTNAEISQAISDYTSGKMGR